MSFFKTLRTKPWLHNAGEPFDYDSNDGFDVPTPRIGLIGFMGVASVLFALLSVAYKMRMNMADWQPLAEPGVLWLNTGILVAASAAMQLAVMAGKSGKTENAKRAMIVAGLFTTGFLIGQYIAWQEMAAAGFFARTNPSYAFFYLLTALHGLHLVGGMVAWGRATARFFNDSKIEITKLGVELCAIYWHFLLALWVLLFALMLST